MRITTKGRYALRAVLQLVTSSNGKPISIRKLAEAEEISPEFLEQIFFKLRKAGIINSTRGPGGGFTLRKDPSKITVTEIFDAIGEGLALSPCVHPESNGKICDRETDCITRKIWLDATTHLREYFSKMTLTGILKKYR